MPSDVAPPVEGAVTPGADARPGEAVRAVDPTRGDHSNESRVQEIAAPDSRAPDSRAPDPGPQAETPRDTSAPDNGGQPATARQGAAGDERRPGNPVEAGSTHTGPRHSAPRRPVPRHAAPNSTTTTIATLAANAEGTKRDKDGESSGATVLQFPPVERGAPTRDRDQGSPNQGSPNQGSPNQGSPNQGRTDRRTRGREPGSPNEGRPSSAVPRPRNPHRRPASSCRGPGAGCGPGWHGSTHPGSPRPWPRSSSR